MDFSSFTDEQVSVLHTMAEDVADKLRHSSDDFSVEEQAIIHSYGSATCAELKKRRIIY